MSKGKTNGESVKLVPPPKPKRTRGAPKFEAATAPPSHGRGEAVYAPPAGGPPPRLPGSGIEVIVDPYGPAGEWPTRVISVILVGDVPGERQVEGFEESDRANIRLLLPRTDQRDLTDLVLAARAFVAAVLVRSDLPTMR